MRTVERKYFVGGEGEVESGVGKAEILAEARLSREVAHAVHGGDLLG